MKEEEKMFFPDFINIENQIQTKEDKVLMLSGLFDYENKDFGFLEEEYKIFIKVLEDNNEDELIKMIKKNSKDYYDRPNEPYCTNYFHNGCLSDCTCSFFIKFIVIFVFLKLMI